MVKKTKRNAQSHKLHNYRNSNSVLTGALDSENRMGTFPRSSTAMQRTRVYPIWVIVLPKEMYVGGVRQVYTEVKVGVH